MMWILEGRSPVEDELTKFVETTVEQVKHSTNFQALRKQALEFKYRGISRKSIWSEMKLIELPVEFHGLWKLL